MSLLFVFGTIVEFALVLYLNQTGTNEEGSMNRSENGFKKENGTPIKRFAVDRNEEKIKSEETSSESLDHRTTGTNEDLHTTGPKEKECFCLQGFTNKVDFACFLAFNFAYLIFNIIYWAAYH